MHTWGVLEHPVVFLHRSFGIPRGLPEIISRHISKTLIQVLTNLFKKDKYDSPCIPRVFGTKFIYKYGLRN
jgi:hypothetical protein